ncbi:hypothetical protein C8R43DRAFT_1138750 [Mycena crocata]|nr:hypothetical protein C8R43DRAFT_1138750 [Mycena crocata]
MPHIWSRVHLLSSFYIPNNLSAIPHLLLLQLERSAHAPLTITLGQGYHYARIIILNALFALAHRWKNVHLELTTWDVRHIEQYHFPTSFPALTKLSLSVEVKDVDYEFENIFQDTPLLEEFDHVACWSRRPLVPRMHLSLSQLKRLRLKMHWIATSDIPSILQLAAGLTEVSFSFCQLRDGTADTSTQLAHTTLSNLESLSISYSDCVFLRYIDVPSLRRLNIIHPRSNATMDFIASFLARSASPLTHLTLGSHGPMTQLPAVLCRVPDLRHLTLTLNGPIIDADLAKRLTCTPYDGENLVPRVTIISFEGNFECDAMLLTDLLRSRCTPLGALRFVRVPDDLLHVLDTLRAEGVDISSI